MRGKLGARKRKELAVKTFNEARALCAGSYPYGNNCHSHTHPFNEARALCAGSFRPCPQARPQGAPSMRPAHYAREVCGLAG